MLGKGDRCPKCGGEIKQGYGLAGGGIGVYSYCETDGCDYFDKVQDHEDDAPAPRPPGSGEGEG